MYLIRIHCHMFFFFLLCTIILFQHVSCIYDDLNCIYDTCIHQFLSVGLFKFMICSMLWWKRKWLVLLSWHKDFSCLFNTWVSFCWRGGGVFVFWMENCNTLKQDMAKSMQHFTLVVGWNTCRTLKVFFVPFFFPLWWKIYYMYAYSLSNLLESNMQHMCLKFLIL